VGKRPQEKVEMAKHLITSSPDTKHKAVYAKALGFARSLWYYQPKLPAKDRLVADQITKLHQDDDTLGQRSLATMLNIGKARVRRVMSECGIEARPRKKRYVYPGKSNVVYPNLLRTDEAALLERLVIFSDIFQFMLADGTQLYGCFALRQDSRQVLSLLFDYSMKSDLVAATVNRVDFLNTETAIWHTDQGRQYGSWETLQSLLSKGFLVSMSRAGTPTDNPFAERFVSTFKHAVVRRRPYHSLGEFLTAAENWINFYNNRRPHQGITNLSPNAYAAQNALPCVPNLTHLTV